MKTQEIWLGDCLELFPKIAAKSVDLVLTDPPFNIARPNNFPTMGRAGLDFGEWDKGADILSHIGHCKRVLKPNGSLVVFNAWRNLGAIANEAEKHGFQTKDVMRYEKTNPMPRNRDRRYITDYEFAIWFTMPKGRWTFNRTDPKYQRPLFKFAIERGFHPTQKPLGLMESLVKIHSNEGDLILDPYAGSGTTLLAAKNLGRNFIGIERDPVYHEIARKRISQPTRQTE